MSDYFQKLKEYVMELEHEVSHEDEETGIMILNNESRGICDLVLDCEDNVLVVEQAVFPVKNDSPEIYKKLLQLNRTLVQGAFTLNTLPKGDVITFRDTLQLENLDFNELEGVLNALTFALIENLDTILALSKVEQKALA